MSFKQWLEATAASGIEKASDRFFGRRATNRQMEPSVVLQTLGLPPNAPLIPFNTKGSAAIVYEYPGDPSKLIKVTGDMNDARAFNKLLKRGFQSQCVVRCHKVTQLPGKAVAIVVDKINGGPMVYSTSMMTALIQGSDYDDTCSAAMNIMRGRPDKVRDQILNKHGKNTPQEKTKLAELFKTLCKLEQMGIQMFDFDSNVLDAGTAYVIVDLGQ